MKERDFFAAMAIEAIIIERGPQTGVGKEQHASMAYDYADAMEAERLKRFRWPQGNAPATEPTLEHYLSSWGSFSESHQRTAKDQAEKLIMDCKAFHVEHTDDVWIFTVLDHDWKDQTEQAYDRLGGGE